MPNIPKWSIYLAVGIVVLAAMLLNIVTRPAPLPTLPIFMEESRDTEPVSATIYIDLKGAVHMPGVYKVSADMRLFQAIRLAGGLREDADVSQINLSAQLFDQQAIIIPFLQSRTTPTDEPINDTPDDTPGKISLNHADATTLETLPGIGPATAQRIIEDRLENGPFEKVEDIMRVSGIGTAIYEGIKPFVIP